MSDATQSENCQCPSMWDSLPIHTTVLQLNPSVESEFYKGEHSSSCTASSLLALKPLNEMLKE